MEAKPICVVYLPENCFGNQMRSIWKDCEMVVKTLEGNKPDYHWFVLPDYSLERVEFKVFYNKDFTPIQYEELKQLVENQINKTV